MLAQVQPTACARICQNSCKLQIGSSIVSHPFTCRFHDHSMTTLPALATWNCAACWQAPDLLYWCIQVAFGRKQSPHPSQRLAHQRSKRVQRSNQPVPSTREADPERHDFRHRRARLDHIPQEPGAEVCASSQRLPPRLLIRHPLSC